MDFNKHPPEIALWVRARAKQSVPVTMKIDFRLPGETKERSIKSNYVNCECWMVHCSSMERRRNPSRKKNIIKILWCVFVCWDHSRAPLDVDRQNMNAVQTNRATKNSNKHWNFCTGFSVLSTFSYAPYVFCLPNTNFSRRFFFLSAAAISWKILVALLFPFLFLYISCSFRSVERIMEKNRRSYKIWLRFNSNWIDFFLFQSHFSNEPLTLATRL